MCVCVSVCVCVCWGGGGAEETDTEAKTDAYKSRQNDKETDRQTTDGESEKKARGGGGEGGVSVSGGGGGGYTEPNGHEQGPFVTKPRGKRSKTPGSYRHTGLTTMTKPVKGRRKLVFYCHPPFLSTPLPVPSAGINVGRRLRRLAALRI